METSLRRSLQTHSTTTFDASSIVEIANSASMSSSPLFPPSMVIDQNHLISNEFQVSPQIRFKPVKKRWVPNRDSLARRRRHGRPGSRRHNRFMNSLYLKDVDFWDMDEDELLEAQNMMSWCPEYHSIFQEMLETIDGQITWAPFTFVTEEEEKNLLWEVCGGEGKEYIHPHSKRGKWEDPDFECAEQNFVQIEKETRRLLKQEFNIRLIKCLEYKLLCDSEFEWKKNENKMNCFEEEFDESLKGGGSGVYFSDWNNNNNSGERRKRRRRKDEDLVIVMKSSRDRKVVHGVCKFYGLLSQSENRSGERITVISRPKQQLPLVVPLLLLSSYLQIRLAKSN